MTTLREAAQRALEACADVVNGWESLAPLAVRRAAVESLDALRAALANQPQTTHSEECWRWHHKCAVAEIERLRAAPRGDKKCRHPDACERDAGGYCRKCHKEMM